MEEVKPSLFVACGADLLDCETMLEGKPLAAAGTAELASAAAAGAAVAMELGLALWLLPLLWLLILLLRPALLLIACIRASKPPRVEREVVAGAADAVAVAIGAAAAAVAVAVVLGVAVALALALLRWLLARADAELTACVLETAAA